jgi:choice-of-anchor A domain-containing protein
VASSLFTHASALVFIAGLSAPATATTLTASQLLNDYNLIVFSDATSNSEVDGRAFVGGNLTGGNYETHSIPAVTGLNALTVGKSLSGNVNVNGPGLAVGGNLNTSSYNGNGGGNAYVGGSWTGSANFNLNGSGSVFLGGTKTGSGNVNGGSLLQNQSTNATLIANVPTAATISTIQNTLTAYSNTLAGLAANSSIGISGNTATFDAKPNAQGVAVFDITDAQTFFSLVGQIAFDINGAKELIVDVSGAGTNNLGIDANFLGGQASSLALDTIWNFTDAKTITVGAQFGGDLLAVHAGLTLNGNLEGTLVAENLMQNAEIHDDGANNNLPQAPLPAAFSLFAAGLSIMGLFGWRRKRNTAALIAAA